MVKPTGLATVLQGRQGGRIQMTSDFPTGETGRMVSPLTERERYRGRKKGAGLREIKSALGVCKLLETPSSLCYSLYILQLLALYPAHSRCS